MSDDVTLLDRLLVQHEIKIVGHVIGIHDASGGIEDDDAVLRTDAVVVFAGKWYLQSQIRRIGQHLLLGQGHGGKADDGKGPSCIINDRIRCDGDLPSLIQLLPADDLAPCLEDIVDDRQIIHQKGVSGMEKCRAMGVGWLHGCQYDRDVFILPSGTEVDLALGNIGSALQSHLHVI